MRHKKNKWKLGKPTDARVALVRNQVSELFEHGYINTTLPRAKAVQSVAERLITQAKTGNLSSIRNVARNLPNKVALRNLLRKVVPAVAEIGSGYTQIAKIKYRRGDGALVVRISVQNYQQSGS